MKTQSNRPTYIKRKLDNVINITKIVTLHYFEFDKNFHFPGEVHDFWEMVYIDSGEVLINADKNSYVLKRGEIIFHKPNEFHTISSNKKTPANVFVISFATVSKSMSYFRNRKMLLPEQLRPYIKTLMREGHETFNLPFNNPGLRELTLKESSPFGGQQLIRTTLEQLLILLVRTQEQHAKKPHIFPDKESMDNHLVGAVLELLNENIYGTITVDEICSKLNYSKAYISKIFNRNCHCTIIEYYTNLKINEAKKLIRENNYTFSKISEMLCFNNPHYFSRVFKKVTNMTPREYLHGII
ncbi:MAG: helix-turn-helix domain-containing protein [Lachnospiraceae bacterium]|nr:helix-turn-helix domain-containing protein [Lachnospiraceae bacterium]